MEAADRDRIILRAELDSDGGTVIGYAVDLTATSVFVVTDWHVPPGSSLSLRLSFPKLVEPVALEGHVEELRIGAGPGEPSGLVIRFDPAGEAHAPLAALLERLYGTAPVPRTAPGPYRMLLVEDNGFIRDVFEYGMSKFLDRPTSYVLDHAENAEQAWEKLAAAEYDLVIVDYYLPAADGANLIARVRSDERLATLPVIAVSVGGNDAREATLSAGADLFLEKPLVFRDLFSTLRVLAQRALIRAPHAKKAILVLDDSPLVLAVTRAALQAAGFEVAVAADLMSFEEQRVSLDPDLILVDVQMPEAFGDDVVSTLRSRGVRVPILLVSSIAEAELASRAQRADAGYVRKDAGVPELVRRCKQVLEAAA